MLGTAVKVTGKQFPRIAKLAERCADTLRIPVPTLYVSPNIGSLNAHTFGTAEDPYIVVNAALIDHLSEPELLDVIGHECGHIQNNHVVYMTTLHFLKHAANMFLRWSVKPAVLALNGWARRAEITCDRAGLICTRDLDVSIGCLVKLALGSQQALQRRQRRRVPGAARGGAGQGWGGFDELTRTHPYLPKRVAALRLFAETTYFRSLVGTGRAAGAPRTRCPRDVEGRVRRARRRADRGAAMSDDARRRRRRRWTTSKAAIRGVLADLARGGRGGGAAAGSARDVRDDAPAQAGRRALLGRRAGRVQPRQVDVHQRAARDAAAADGDHADDGAARARHARRARGGDGGDRERRAHADRRGARWRIG